VIPFGINRNENVYQNALAFNPDRWKEPKLPAVIPFGNGAHRCKGEQFALLEMKTVAAILFSEYDVQLVEEPVKIKRGVIFPKPDNALLSIRKRVK
jgi:sterol 14-demethylase